ncbi:MAG: hypothetical protein WCG21_11800 [Eubacteriales bacterium]
MSKCKYLSDTGICKVTSDGEVSEPCVMGPCGKEAFEVQPRFDMAEMEAIRIVHFLASLQLPTHHNSKNIDIYKDAVAIVQYMTEEVTKHD